MTARTIRAAARGGVDAEMVLRVPGKIERRFRGHLEVSVERDVLVVIVIMDQETAVASAVAAESPPGASIQALKAQAVVTRSYYTATKGRHTNFHFCDTTHCQYVREPPPPDHPAAIATSETLHLVLRYQRTTVGALFSASCGGRTRTLAEIGFRSSGYPYFPVDCLYCRSRAPQWERRLAARDTARLREGSGSENARLEVGRRLGWNTVPGNNYQIHQEDETVVFYGRGRGHGVGLCQVGAAAMAAAGMNFGGILSHYYPNTTLAMTDLHEGR